MQMYGPRRLVAVEDKLLIRAAVLMYHRVKVNLCFLGLWVMVFLSFYIIRTSHVQAKT